MNNFISTPTVIFLSLLLDEMPNLATAIFKYAALGPLPEIEIRGMSLLAAEHIQEARSHHNTIVVRALRTIAAIYDLELAVVNKSKFVEDSLDILSSKLMELAGQSRILERTAEITKEDNQEKSSDLDRAIQDAQQQQKIFWEQEDELSELKEQTESLFVSVDELVAQHESLWQSHQQAIAQSLAKQLQKLHSIALTQEELASLRDDTSRSIADKKEQLEKVKISVAKKATDHEVLVHHIIWQWISRSLKPIEEETKIFKSLTPYLKQEVNLREQLQKEIESKYAAINDSIKSHRETLAKSVACLEEVADI